MSKDVSFRKTWDTAEYALKAAERSTGVRQAPPNYSAEINFKALINTTKSVQSVDESGFNCLMCSLTFKDNIKYIDHCNSREHMALMGHSAVPRSTLKQVVERLSQQKIVVLKVDPKTRMDLRIKNEMLSKTIKKQERKIKRDLAVHIMRPEAPAVDAEILGQMGFASFK